MKLHSMVILNIPNGSPISPAKMREKFRRLRGVLEVHVNSALDKVTVEFDSSEVTVDEIRALLIGRGAKA